MKSAQGVYFYNKQRGIVSKSLKIWLYHKLASAKALSVRIRASTLIGLTYITLVGIYMVDIAEIVESSLSDCMIANDGNMASG